MGNLALTANTSTDGDYLRLFQGAGDVAAKIIVRIKHDDPEVKTLTIKGAHLGGEAWNHLGHILAQSTHVKELNIGYCHVNLAELCRGLFFNQSIQQLYFMRATLQGVIHF